MRGPSLQKTALLSFVLHLTAFLIVFLILRQSNHMIMSPSYTVSLVNPSVFTGADKGKEEEAVRESKEPSVPAPAAEVPRKSKKEAMKEKKLVQDKISALAAKKKKIDTLSRLHEIISLKAGARKGNANSKAASPAAGKGKTFDEYYSKIMEEIHDQWRCPPDVCKKNLEAVISVKILKDGTVVQRVEKPSGNILFDRLAQRALAKASPLTPPPYEMEIGVRFYP